MSKLKVRLTISAKSTLSDVMSKIWGEIATQTISTKTRDIKVEG